MFTGPSLIPALTVSSASVTAGVAIYTWRHSEKPGAKMFVALLVGATLWSVAYAAALSTFDPGLNRTFATAAWIGRLIMPLAWVVFALQYTGRGTVLTKPVVALLAVNPGITLGVLATQGTHQLMWRDYHVVAAFGAAVGTYGNGPWLVWQTVYGYALIGAGLLLLLDMQYSEGRLYRGQAIALVISAAIPTVANVAWLLKLGPAPSLDLTPVTFSVTGVLMGYALFRHNLFGLVPATRRVGQQVALDYLGDGVVVIDDDHRVIDVNATAEDILDCDASSVLGEPIEAILPDPGVDLMAEGDLVEVDQRIFEITATPVLDRHERQVGSTLMFHDVTSRVRRKQLLSVLNRVLRHNLRNEINVIRGYAEMLDGDVDGPEAEFVSLIEERSEILLELGDKARELERVILEDAGSRSQVCVSRLLRSVAGRVAEQYPDGEVVIDAPEALPLEVDSTVIETVLTNVMENAFEHNDSTLPSVSVSLARTGSSIELTVADNGPGIPDQELVILGSEAETPLEHSSGLGLWLVSWSVTALGGEVAFEENEPRGTVVRIRLPDAQSGRSIYDPMVA